MSKPFLRGFWNWPWVLLLCLPGCRAPVRAADQLPPVSSVPKTDPKAPDADGQIETMLHYAMPTPQHQLLDRMAGSWTVVLRYQAFPDTEAVETTGHAERRWILGGRFLMEELDGGNLALPMQGLGLFGFDVFEQKHSSVWLDTMNTAILSNLGTYDPINELVSFAGDYKDPWTGTKKKERGVLRLMGRDRQVLEIHVSGTNGVEFKMIELAYTRKVAPPKIR